uniref:RING-type domain-containing protein n=1 Tax=Fundulus heteroclitus TaxID=8078 RepID=A0A3Q2PQP2_FUNHE
GLNKSTPQRKCYDPKDPSLKFVDREDDLDFLCEDFASPRAEMSCGHAVTPTSLTNWCLKLLEDGKNSFVCGASGCNAVWPYEEVCKMALLTTEEMKVCFIKCPGCKSPVARQNEFNLCVSCKTCTEKGGRLYEFCWQCQREWKGPKPRLDRCENDGITGCPSIRACPTCGSLLEHKRNHCKHLTCPQCKIKFCFVCLKTFAECSKTSGISAPCSSGVAPRQTFIPVWSKENILTRL